VADFHAAQWPGFAPPLTATAVSASWLNGKSALALEDGQDTSYDFPINDPPKGRVFRRARVSILVKFLKNPPACRKLLSGIGLEEPDDREAP
jgi:hypothetical protein